MRCKRLLDQYGSAGESSECIKATVTVEPHRWADSNSVNTFLSAYISADRFQQESCNHLKERHCHPLFERNLLSDIRGWITHRLGMGKSIQHASAPSSEVSSVGLFGPSDQLLCLSWIDRFEQLMEMIS